MTCRKQEEKYMEDYKKTPLWDSRLPIQERLDYLLREMTIDEKLRFLGTTTPELPRLGIGRMNIGGEAAHGVEARHDQDDIGYPEPTTSFPQPIGMSATWDPELIEKAGEVTGLEARVLFGRHPDRGLFRWAPTVDMERDPRWGRTEEAYGEDPYLTGKVASAFVRGMQGEDPDHLRISSALKHFFANNVENGRGVKSSSLDARNRNDYYYEPFRRLIEEGGATSLMTAYNKVNGRVCMLDPRVNELIREKWGLHGHIVCDGGAMSMVYNDHKATVSHAETVEKSLKAGVDCMTDKPEIVEAAAREAYAQGRITEEDIDRALRHSFETKLRLGLYDAYDTNPWNHVEESALDSEECRRISLKTADEAVVLLKNNGLLPLHKDQSVALIGPLADQWYQDWYGGEPIYRSTVRTGMEAVLGHEVKMEDGLDLVLLRSADGKYGKLDENGVLYLTEQKEEAEIFSMQDWGDDNITLYVPRLQRYLMVHDEGELVADKKAIFGWFVKESFHRDGARLQTWYKADLCLDENGKVVPGKTVQDWAIGEPQTGELKETGKAKAAKPIEFEMEIVKNGIEDAAAFAKTKDAAVLVLGCCPVLNGKEDCDRLSIQFPPSQRALAQAVYAANPNTVMVLLTNYPYALDWEQENLPAILMTASGSQDTGNAAARAVFGLSAPAGRLNMTWYDGAALPPDMDDYDIMKTKRTYRYYEGKALYPFGYGLTYTTFEYQNLCVEENADHLTVRFCVTNKGTAASDEVAQVYVKAPEGRAKKPIRQLVGFCRIHDIQPGETQEVVIDIPKKELNYYDVVRGDFMVEEGNYRFEIGASSEDIRLQQELFVAGEKTGSREKGRFIWADHWDNYENAVLEEGPEGYSCETCSAAALDPAKPAWMEYRDCSGLTDGCSLKILVNAPTEGSLEVYAGEKRIASWSGKTEGFETICLTAEKVPEGERMAALKLNGTIFAAGFTIE